MKKILLTLSIILGVNTSTVMAELTQTELHATMGIVTNFILDDSIIHNGTTYGTVTSPFTGKIWLDRNLGASRVCTSFDDVQCYGDYYQWGRNFDGHQDSTSGTTSTQATNVNFSGSSFVTGSSDWTSVDNGSLRAENWSKTDGSSVCPIGFRVPSITELIAETLDNGAIEKVSAFSNFLKLPSAGHRDNADGIIYGVGGSWGDVWSSSTDMSREFETFELYFDAGELNSFYGKYARGLSVRCIKD